MLANFALWLQDAAPATTPVTETAQRPVQQPGFSWDVFILPLMLFGIFYLLVFRPQRKQQKARMEMISAIKKGDRVMTSGGMIGTVTNLKEDEVTLEVDENVRIRFSRGAVSQVLNAEEKAKETVGK